MRNYEVLDKCEQLYRLSSYRVGQPEFTYKSKDSEKTLHDQLVFKELARRSKTEKSVSTYELGQISNQVIDDIRNFFIQNSNLSENEYNFQTQSNLKILNLFYIYVFFEFYLSLIEDIRRKADKNFFKKLDKKCNKESIEIYRNVTLLAFITGTEKELELRAEKLNCITENQFSWIMPKIPFTTNVYHFLRQLVINEEKINIMLFDKNFFNNTRSKLSADAFKEFSDYRYKFNNGEAYEFDKSLLEKILKPRVFHGDNSEGVKSEFLFRKSIKDLRLSLSQKGIFTVASDYRCIRYGDEKLNEYYNNLLIPNPPIPNHKVLRFNKSSLFFNKMMTTFSNEDFSSLHSMI